MNKMQSLAQFTPSDGHIYKLQQTPPEPASRSRTLGSTPYTPSTPSVPQSGGPHGIDSLSKGTIDNLFNISLSGTPEYVDEEEGEGLVMKPTKPVGRPMTDEESIDSVKKGKKLK